MLPSSRSCLPLSPLGYSPFSYPSTQLPPPPPLSSGVLGLWKHYPVMLWLDIPFQIINFILYGLLSEAVAGAGFSASVWTRLFCGKCKCSGVVLQAIAVLFPCYLLFALCGPDCFVVSVCMYVCMYDISPYQTHPSVVCLFQILC